MGIPTNSSTFTGVYCRVTVGDLCWTAEGLLTFVYQVEHVGTKLPVILNGSLAICIFFDEHDSEIGVIEYRITFARDFRTGKARMSVHDITVPVPEKAIWLVVQSGADVSERTNKVRIPARGSHNR